MLHKVFGVTLQLTQAMVNKLPELGVLMAYKMKRQLIPLIMTTNKLTVEEAAMSLNFAVGEGFFDIQKYNGNGSSTQVVSHEMNAVPAMMIVKRIDTSDEWIVYHKNLGGSSWWTFNSDTAKKDGDTRWGGQNPSSTDFTVGGDASVNSSVVTLPISC